MAAWPWWRVAGTTGRALEVLWKAARILPCRMGTNKNRLTQTEQDEMRDRLPATAPSAHRFPHRFPPFRHPPALTAVVACRAKVCSARHRTTRLPKQEEQ